MRRKIAIALGVFVVTATLASYPRTGLTRVERDYLESKLDYGIDFWREAEGLPQSRIRAIVQTRDGYLWLGNG